MIILGIETSCDETAAAVIQDGNKILSNVTATSAGIHARTGGVIPEDAARKQLQSVIPVIELVLKDASLSQNEIDCIAVTKGPGLIGSLLVGVETAKTLSWIWNKPIIPVNHLVAHLYANWLSDKQPDLPAVGLVVSGGHTDLIYMSKHGQIKLIGQTRDDAAGEAFDKTARLLGIAYPGGPNLSSFAKKYLDENPHKKLELFPRPMINEGNYDWSFSGLKTAVLRYMRGIVESKEALRLADYEKIAALPQVQETKDRIAAEIQEAIVDVIVTKTTRAIEKYSPKSFLLAGGVAANLRLREKFDEKLNKTNVAFFVPKLELCTDNAAYIAACAYFNNNPVSWHKIDANPELTITS